MHSFLFFATLCPRRRLSSLQSRGLCTAPEHDNVAKETKVSSSTCRLAIDASLGIWQAKLHLVSDTDVLAERGGATHVSSRSVRCLQEIIMNALLLSKRINAPYTQYACRTPPAAGSVAASQVAS